MGKRIISQRRGRGTPTYRVRERNYRVKLQFGSCAGRVKEIFQDRGRMVPVALIEYDDGKKGHVPAREGLSVNDRIDGMVVPLSEIPEARPIFAIECVPNSGPVFCRSGGSFASIVSKDDKACIVVFPSRKTRAFNPLCRAIVGVPAGGGRGEKPWVRAGSKWRAMHRKGRLYPITSANCMNAVDHPFGGSYSGVNGPKTVSRNAPPGRKVGSIAARRTGRKR
ncbi:MAG: 50S ribosomal protein L2 [Candidatus Aenigmatarchaeota archaeon]